MGRSRSRSSSRGRSKSKSSSRRAYLYERVSSSPGPEIGRCGVALGHTVEGDVVLPLGDLGPRVEEDGGRVEDVQAGTGRVAPLLVLHQAADVGLVVHPRDLLDQDRVVDEALQLRALEEPAVAHLLGVGQGLAQHLEAVPLPHHLLVHHDLHVGPEPHLHLQGQGQQRGFRIRELGAEVSFY